ncbi:MAG: hypothetical protein AAFN93_20385 [Bacteroidota bacterium]
MSEEKQVDLQSDASSLEKVSIGSVAGRDINVIAGQVASDNFISNNIFIHKFEEDEDEAFSIVFRGKEHTRESFIETIESEIRSVRESAINLISVKQSFLKLVRLYEPAGNPYSNKSNEPVLESSLEITSQFGQKDDRQRYLMPFDEILNELSKIEFNKESVMRIQGSLIPAIDTINIDTNILRSFFLNFFYSAVKAPELMESMKNKIGPEELKREAQMHLEVASSMREQLNIDLNYDKGTNEADKFDIVKDYTKTTLLVEVIYEIEKRKIEVSKLVTKDLKGRYYTSTLVIAYLTVVILGLTFFLIYNGQPSRLASQALADRLVPFFEIPWPVLLWSFIGSLAAMIYEFNRKPLYDFGNVAKWLITRPVQGVVLGSAFYLVLVSGLLLLTGSNPSESADSARVDEVILVLSFLVGFSDKFADSVFNTLVDRYTHKRINEQNPTNES